MIKQLQYFGQNSYGSFERLFESGDWNEAWRESMSIHVEGMMQSFRYTRKALLKSDRGGVFIGLSSIAGAMVSCFRLHTILLLDLSTYSY